MKLKSASTLPAESFEAINFWKINLLRTIKNLRKLGVTLICLPFLILPLALYRSFSGVEKLYHKNYEEALKCFDKAEELQVRYLGIITSWWKTLAFLFLSELLSL